MKNVVVLAAVAGLASAASAGGTATLTIVPSSTTVDSSVTTSFSLAIWGSADFGTHLAGGAFGLDATGGAGIVTGMSWATAAWGAANDNDRGAGMDGDYVGVVFGQGIVPSFNLLPQAGTAVNPGDVFIGSFTVDIAANSEGTINWSTIDDIIAAFVLEVYDDGGTPTNDDDDIFTRITSNVHGSASVNIVVPAPSSMALLGLGGLVAGRRRR